MIDILLAQATEYATPVGILISSQAGLCAAMVALYRDCRSDRSKLWEHVRELEKRIHK